MDSSTRRTSRKEWATAAMYRGQAGAVNATSPALPVEGKKCLRCKERNWLFTFMEQMTMLVVV